ncbi:MAG: multicopper oxidase domain-containing protein [Candidatus Eremiobacteraeota bacterium]|nr:multicopper oxidase domain-containing protein [Candidatus Eremiobacteraeota bacterium]
MIRVLVIAVLATFGATAALPLKSSPAEAIAANENRVPAGTRTAGAVHVSLDARWGSWRPDGDGQPSIPMQAFAEAGKPLQIPGPLIRVPIGTEVVVRLRNSIPGTVLTIHGLVDRPARIDRSFTVAFRSTKTVRFAAGVAGTYKYWATTDGRNEGNRYGWDSQLSGAIVVDPAGAKVDVRNDRVFVIGNWISVIDPNGLPARRYELLTINGRSWPHTERLSYAQGTNVHWRWINTSTGPHPIHLHGFYFHVDSRGNGIADNDYRKRADRDLEVTELVPVTGTFAMTWTADRPGNWLIHCHIPSHQAEHFPSATLVNAKSITLDEYENVHLRNAEMGGMVLAFTVHPSGSWHATVQTPERHLRLLVEPAYDNTPTAPAFRYVLADGEDRTDTGTAIGPPIVLTQGVPVAINVENHLAEPTAVHWHGMELSDSYYDGVGGVSGYGTHLAPMIVPGSSFGVQFTPPRAGTFIYHTHMHDVWQLRGGLAGPMIVLPKHARFDTDTDHIVMITTATLVEDLFKYVLINGNRHPPSMVLRAGVPHRFRFINMTTTDAVTLISMESESGPVLWRPLAMDGANLPATRRSPERAVRTLTIGKTLDFEFTPATRGDMSLIFRQGFQPAPIPARGPRKGGLTLPPAGAILGTLNIHVI